MRAVVQRVLESNVTVNSEIVGQINAGMLVLLGIAEGDTDKDVNYMANKISGLRIFDDADGKMNRSLIDVQGEMLVVSQFTLLGDVRKGKRPSFIRAANPDEGNQLYLAFCTAVKQLGIPVETGQFQAHMDVQLVNDGPVTIILDSKKDF